MPVSLGPSWLCQLFLLALLERRLASFPVPRPPKITPRKSNRGAPPYMRTPSAIARLVQNGHWYHHLAPGPGKVFRWLGAARLRQASRTSFSRLLRYHREAFGASYVFDCSVLASIFSSHDKRRLIAALDLALLSRRTETLGGDAGRRFLVTVATTVRSIR